MNYIQLDCPILNDWVYYLECIDFRVYIYPKQINRILFRGNLRENLVKRSVKFEIIVKLHYTDTVLYLTLSSFELQIQIL